jgi:hypothetical protein
VLVPTAVHVQARVPRATARVPAVLQVLASV